MKAEQKRAQRKSSNQRIRRGSTANDREGDIDYFHTDSDGSLESVDDVISSSDQRLKFMSYYRGLAYFKYLDAVTDFDPLEELESKSTTQQLILFQAADSISDYIIKSPLEDLYRAALSKLKTFHDYTTVRVAQSQKMQVDVGRNNSDDNLIMKFRLHASMRDGVEPRLHFGDNVQLRYDPLEQETILEYSTGF